MEKKIPINVTSGFTTVLLTSIQDESNLIECACTGHLSLSACMYEKQIETPSELIYDKNL